VLELRIPGDVYRPPLRGLNTRACVRFDVFAFASTDSGESVVLLRRIRTQTAFDSFGERQFGV
jgi:hypothetical protein